MELGEYDQLIWIRESLRLMWPEITLIICIVLLIVASLFESLRGFTKLIAIAGGVVYVSLLIGSWSAAPTRLFGGMLSQSGFATTLKIIMGVALLLSFLMTRKKERMEYYLLLTSVLLGSGLMIMSQNFVMVLLAMELVSISSYVITSGSDPDKRRAEAAWKFFLFGSVSTAVMVFGMSYLFGITGTTDFGSIQFQKTLSAQDPVMVSIGGIMTCAGFLFKMTAAPFHLWAPDVYETTRSPVVAFLSVVPKLAGLGIIVKILFAMNLSGQSWVQWPAIVASVAVFSILVGTLAALGQKDAKRMMAYSTVAQAGFLLAVISIFEMEGIQISLFYAAVFAIANYTSFLVIQLKEEDGKSTNFQAFSGVGTSNPLASIAITLALVSLAGLPPVAGFMSKFLVFSALWAKFQQHGQVIFLITFVVGLLATVASLFFYMKIPFYLFFRRSEENETIKTGVLTNLLLAILVGLLLALFFAPALLMGWVNKVNFVL